MFKTRLSSFLLIVFIFFSFQKSFSQCFEIESILVDACDSGSNEGLNEMVRFKVGSANLNTTTMSVTWPNPSTIWSTLIQNSATASKVALMNAQILAAGGCGQIIEPVSGVLPANSEVLLVTSNNFSLSLNVFGPITQNIYILFQNNPTNTSGHFANYNLTSGLRTLIISFGASCSDSVTYDRSLLVNINGTYGPAFPDPTADTLNNGATVNFTPTGTASYVNNGCVAPVPVFSVDAGTTPITACSGATVSLRGTAQGQQSVAWSAPSGSFSSPTSLVTNYTVGAGAIGSVILTLTATNPASCIANIIDTVTLNIGTISNPIIDSIVQPTCATATGSVTLSGLPSGNWTINPGAILGTTATVTISGLATGTSNYTVTNAAGCTSLASANVVIGAQLSNPTAPIIDSITQPTCITTTGSVTLSGLPSGNWTINPGAISGSTATVTISGLATGSSNYTVTNATNCTSLASANVVIGSQPGTPTVPIIDSITQPTCAIATGSAALSGLPSGNWTINPGAISGSSTTVTISGLATGTANYTVTNASNCTSSATANFVIVAQPVTSSAPIIDSIIQPTCTTSTGSVTLSGLPSGNWTINPGAILGSTATVTISGLITGTSNYTVTNAAGCTSLASANVVVNVQPVTPTIPIIDSIIQPTCATATGSVTLSGLPSGNWIINPGAISGSTATVTISGLATGTANYTVTNATNCTSLASANVVIVAQPVTSSAPVIDSITHPTCTTSTGSVTLSGLPLGNWTITPGAILGSTATVTISGLATGTSSYSVTNAAGCTSLASANVVINAIPTTSSPTFPIVAPICFGTTITLPLVSNNGVSGTWSPIFDTTTTTTYTFTPDPGQCSSPTTLQVQIIPTPSVTASPSTETICSLQATGILLSGSILGTTFNWTVLQTDVSGANNDTGNSISQVLTATGIDVGNVIYTITPMFRGCPGTPVIATVYVTPKPVISVTNSSPSICSGTATSISFSSSMLNTVYNWNVIQTNVTGASAGSGNTIAQVLSTIGTSSGVVVYAITPTVNGCPGATILSTIIVNPIPTLTINPALGETICSGSTTNIALASSVVGTTFNWTEVSNNTIGSSSGTGTSIAQMLTVITPVLGSVIYTITTDSNGCVGASGSVTVTVKPIPSVTSPSIFGETICSGDSISVVLTPSLLGTTLSWTVLQNGVSGATSGIGNTIADTLFTTGNNSGLAVYTVKPILNSCPGLPMLIPVLVNILPTPTLTDGIICVDAAGVAFRTYTLNSGLNSIDYSFQWFIDGIAQVTGGPTFEAFVAGNYSVIATNILTGCVSLPVSATVIASNPANSFTATVTSLYFSDNATITASALGGNGTYQFSLDYGPFQTSPIFENVAPGEHTISINDTNGCTSLLPITLNIIGYPTYFTPNGDGFHDYWNIIGLENQPTAKVYIFDRYGKLIKQISTKSLGWDGTYNGNPMPSSDYWFTIEYLEPAAKTYKAHFSLKR